MPDTLGKGVFGFAGMVNHALHVQAVGFQPQEGGFLGVLIAPRFMNLIFLPPDTPPSLQATEKEVIRLASGDCEFLHNMRDLVGP